MVLFLGFGILLLVQSSWSLLDGFRFLRLATRKPEKRASYAPRAGVVIPCKGVDAGFNDNLDRYLNQWYTDYEVVLVVASQADPAYERFRERVALPADSTTGRPAPKTQVIAAGLVEARGEKVHNLLRGLDALSPEAEVLAFADMDASVPPNWLSSLVAPLRDRAVTASTGFRWYLPGAGFASQLQAAWDTSIATLLDERNPMFAWGGSMAIRAADFRRLQVAERYWARTLSDDYALTRAVRDAGGRIVFEPRCLVASREDLTLSEFVRWSTRQITLTRVYAPRLWWQGAAAHALYCGTFVFGAAVLAMPHAPAGARLPAAAILLAVLSLGAGKGWIRTRVTRALFASETPSLTRRASCYWRLAPLVPWVMAWNYVASAFTRTITWRGTQYELDSRGDVQAVTRDNRQV